MYIKDLSKRVILRISDDNYDKLNMLASERKVTLSRLLREIIESYLISYCYGGNNGDNKTDFND